MSYREVKNIITVCAEAKRAIFASPPSRWREERGTRTGTITAILKTTDDFIEITREINAVTGWQNFPGKIYNTGFLVLEYIYTAGAAYCEALCKTYLTNNYSCL